MAVLTCPTAGLASCSVLLMTSQPTSLHKLPAAVIHTRPAGVFCAYRQALIGKSAAMGIRQLHLGQNHQARV